MYAWAEDGLCLKSLLPVTPDCVVSIAINGCHRNTGAIRNLIQKAAVSSSVNQYQHMLNIRRDNRLLIPHVASHSPGSPTTQFLSLSSSLIGKTLLLEPP